MGIDQRTGDRLAGYVLGERIGRGGMGVVYRATHVHLGREVALKLLAPELAGEEDFRERFLRESRLAASLDHPNVIPVYDAGEVDGTLYIAMRFVEGTDLAELLRREAPLASSTALSMLDQVGAALDAAHRRGLIHRDVKPANVLITSGNCYLADFGLTKRASATDAALTRTGMFLGTVDYVAPEQIEGREIDGRADVYALAGMLHECLTGARPFPKDSELAIISAHLRDPPPRPSALRPELPAAIDEVVATGLAKSADDRYATCAELLAAARGALGASASEAAEAIGVDRQASVPPRRGTPNRPAAATVGASGVADDGRTVMDSRRRRPGRRVVIPGAAALCLAAVVAAIIVLSSGATHTRTPAKPSTKLAAAAHPSAATPAAHVVGNPIQVGQAPTGIAGDSSVLWVANFQASTVTRVTPNGKVRTDIALPPAPFAVFKSGNTFWVSSADAGVVTPISVASGLPGKPTPVGSKPEWLTGDQNALYVSNVASDTVSVINARTGAPIGSPIRVGNVPRGIAFSGSAVWVADSDDDNVDRIVDGQVIKSIPVGHRPIGVAFGADALWVANENDDTVSRIDLAQDTVKAIKVGKAPFAIAFGLGSAWVTNSGDNTVTRLDASTGDPVGPPVAVGQDPTGITVIGDGVWVTNRRSNTVQEIEP
ncbi:MAG: protein kinase [Solirubrobacterales bacterium]|nr:protein kinase [Solirubrobacterales bacterium]